MNTKKETVIYLTLILTGALGLSATPVLAQSGNTAYGINALLGAAILGNQNSAFGEDALRANAANDNTASGYKALRFNTLGNYNTASGSQSLQSNTSGSYNTASGYKSLYLNTEGQENTAMGYSALYFNKASSNAAVGAYSQYSNTTGTFNTSFGDSALYSNTTGLGNAAQGRSALYSNTTGDGNVGIGNLAGYVNTTGSNNIFIGRAAGLYETTSNNLYISNNAIVPLLYGKMSSTPSANKLGIGVFNVPAGDAIAVWNGAHLTTGGVWTNASSRDLKDNIEALSTEDANAALAALSPVRYVYKNSRDEEYVGFIAEDVPDLVATNDHKSLSPMDIVAVLTTVTKEQKAEIAVLSDSLAKQEAINLKQEAAFQEQEDRVLQLEMALAELLRNQSSKIHVGLID